MAFAVRNRITFGNLDDGFPVFHGVIFWQYFIQWRKAQNGFKIPAPS